MVEHHIQRDILMRLMKAKSLRFSELKPDGMESNSFMYHLKQLMRDGYVMQNADKSYTLSSTGLSYSDSLSLENSLPRKQPKMICMIALKNKRGEYLLAQRLMQPMIGSWIFPNGKQHFEESPEEHVARESLQQFGTTLDLAHRGIADIRVSLEGTLITHVVGHVYSGDYDGAPPPDTQKFHFEWRDTQSIAELMPSMRELVQALENDDEPFFLSLDSDAK